jgi:hypothetical protein
MPKRTKSNGHTGASELAIPAVANAAEVPSVYSNAIELLSGNHIDVRLAFNEVVIESGNRLTTVRRANVVMSVPAFMTMVQVLSANAQVLAAAIPQQQALAEAKVKAAIEAQAKNRPK